MQHVSSDLYYVGTTYFVVLTYVLSHSLFFYSLFIDLNHCRIKEWRGGGGGGGAGVSKQNYLHRRSLENTKFHRDTDTAARHLRVVYYTRVYNVCVCASACARACVWVGSGRPPACSSVYVYVSEYARARVCVCVCVCVCGYTRQACICARMKLTSRGANF